MQKNTGLETRTITESFNNTSNDKQDMVAQEVPIAFAYNGQSHAVMMASPLDLDDYAIGFSLTERIVDSASDILDIEIREAKQGITVQLRVKPQLADRLKTQRRQMSGRSSCGVCGISDLAAAIPKLEPLAVRTKPSHQTIDAAIKTFLEQQSLQQQCGAVHCAALFSDAGELIDLREDIGRHNALDKLIGAQAKRKESRNTARDSEVDGSEFILMSSRASHELITKAVIAGVGSLVTISAATTLAIDMAAKLNLNLVGFVRGERQIIYHTNQPI